MTFRCTQKAWLVTWYLLVLLVTIGFAYSCHHADWLHRWHWNLYIKEQQPEGDENVYGNRTDHRFLINLFTRHEYLNGRVARSVRLIGPNLVDPYSDYWRVSMVLAVAANLLNFVTSILFPYSMCCATYRACFSEINRQKTYKKFRCLLQFLCIASLVTMYATLLSFAMGFQNRLTTGQVYLDYGLYCGNPSPFQTDRCAIGLGMFYASLCAVLQLVVCVISFAENCVKIEPIRKRAKSVIIEDERMVMFMMEQYRRMQNRLSRIPSSKKDSTVYADRINSTILLDDNTTNV